MSADKMREEFEVWAMKKHSHYLSPFKRVDGSDPRIDGADRYLHGEVQQDWAVWQASRAAIEVELPSAWTGKHKMTGEPLPHGLMNSTEVRQAIESIGLKVKS